MPEFTMALKDVLELRNDPGTGLRIGLNDYPLFDVKHRLTLNRLIIQQYWNREIGMETVSMFEFAMRRKMHQIMPYWNQVYKTTLLSFDPISNYSLKTKRDDVSDETSDQATTAEGTSNSKNKSKSVSSETPQANLSRQGQYATGATDANTEGDTTSENSANVNSTTNTTLNGTSETTGYQGSPSDLLTKFRDTLLNVDMMVVDAVEDCFMMVWSNGDEILPDYTKLRLPLL